MVYEVYGNYGGALFSDQDDAIAALWLLGLYHDIEQENIINFAKITQSFLWRQQYGKD